MENQYSTFKFFSSPEKEEAWLESMAEQGWFLTRVTGFYRYVFTQGQPEKRSYKIDYRTFRKADDRADYLAMFADSGWQAVQPKEMNGAFYFRSPEGSARRDIFSDDVSRAQRNLRYAQISACSILPSFLPFIVIYLSGNFGMSDVGYLTPGLWQMQGLNFVFHFLFETPFVIMRSGILPLLPFSLMLFFLLRYYLIYRKTVRQQAI